VPEFDVIQLGTPEPPRRRRAWRVTGAVLVAAAVGVLVVHGALTDSGRRPRAAVTAPEAPSPSPVHLDPALAGAARAAMPEYPQAIPPIGLLDAETRFVGVYEASPGQHVQLDLACDGVGTVLLGIYPDTPAPSASGHVLADVKVPCTDRPSPVTVTVQAPPDGRYQVAIWGAAGASGVLAWRLIPW
jgi:hypothetical protein